MYGVVAISFENKLVDDEPSFKGMRFVGFLPCTVHKPAGRVTASERPILEEDP
jgi:hypothetical protein